MTQEKNDTDYSVQDLANGKTIDISSIDTSSKVKEKKEDERPKFFDNEEKTKKENKKLSADEEDLNIDFSKIKDKISNLFKSEDDEKEKINVKTKDKELYKPKEEPSDEEELSFDFSKIKNTISNLFKSDEKEKKQIRTDKNEDSDDFGFDTKKVVTFVKSNKVLLLILIPLFLSMFLRMQPAYLPIADDWATSSVNAYFKSEIKAQIDSQYPNLPESNKNSLVNNEFENFLKENKETYQAQIDATAAHYRSELQDENSNTYLLAIDPYFWMRHARNVLENGHPGDEIKDDIPWDNHMFAPNGRPADVSFHSYFMAYLYKFVSLFNKNATLMGVAFFIPVLISALAVIPAFFIGRKMAGNFAGLVSGVIVAIHPSFLSRTAGGFSDTDAYNVMFPLFATWFFLEAFETDDLKKKMIYSALSAFSIGLFSFTWIGAWYIFDFILGAIGLFFVYSVILYFIKNKKFDIKKFINEKTIKNTLILLGSILVFTLLFSSLFLGFTKGSRFVMNAPFQPFEFSKIKVVGIYSIWPNVFTTVAEQNESNFKDVINSISMGNRALFLISLIGLALMFRKNESGKVNVKEAILLILWFGATIYASVKGVRFMLLLVPAFSIAFGVAFGIFYNYLSKWITKNLSIHKAISSITIIVILSLFLISPIKQSLATAENEIPSMNDGWWSSLENIRLNSAPDAIINSWWDFGHWFKYIGDRAVTFDGTSQGTPQAHWIGNALLTDDGDIAVGILRMLDCSGYQGGSYAYDAAYNITNDQVDAINLLYEVMPVSKDDAKILLEEKEISKSKIDSLLMNTHCNPPEDYFITSDDMIGKSGVWAHFGSWDFDRALIYNRLKNKTLKNNKDLSVQFLQERFGYDTSTAENLYYEVASIKTSEEANSWISPWPSYASSFEGCRVGTNDTITCGVGNAVVEVNLDTLDSDIKTADGVKHITKVVLLTEDGFKEKDYSENIVVDIAMLIVPTNNGYSRILMHPSLSKSMFTRLFFLDGHATTHFKEFSDTSTVFGGRVIVWKVDWGGNEDNVYSFYSKEEVEETVEQVLDVEEESLLEEEQDNSSSLSPEIQEEEPSDENMTNEE